MKFMLIVHHDEAAFEKIDKERRQQMLAESIDLTHHLHAAGQYIHASPLQPAETAVIIRVREGKSMVTDGPFAETKEQIGGYFLIDAQDREEAVGIAERVPGARIGTVEVRPLRDIKGLPRE
jgi:hypothetical protein